MKLIDLTGQRFGKLVVVGRGSDYVSPRGFSSVRWICRCDCGNTTEVGRTSLKSGSIKSCGCERNAVRNMEYEKSNGIVLCKCKGGAFLIDECDYDFVSGFGWHISNSGYPCRNNDKRLLHRLLMNPPGDKVVDHINGDKLDNRRSNLRIANNSINGYNRAITPGCSGEYCISYNKASNYYSVYIDGMYCGGSKDIEKAKEIRDSRIGGSKIKKYNRFLNGVLPLE